MGRSGSTRDRDDRSSVRFGGLLPLILLSLCATALAGCVIPQAGGAAGGGTGSPAIGVVARRGFIHGAESSSAPPFLRVASPGTSETPKGFGSAQLTLEIDLLADAPPTLTLVLIHCDKDWVPTRNTFIQDRSRLRSTDFEIFFAPIGVRNYDYNAIITFPSESNPIEIEHSGNYIARVVDAFDETKVIGEYRFFAVESAAGVRVEMISDFFESAWTTKSQEGIRARVEVDPGITLFGSQFNAIHLIESGKWSQPRISEERMRLTEERGDYRATWSSWFGGKILAEFANLPSGNEHRVLDLTDIMTFPSTDEAITTRLSDQPRYANYSERDYDGIARFDFVPPEYNDYVYFEFRLDIEGEKVYDDMAVVGTFNDWTPTWEWRLVFEPVSRRYVARGWIKRGVHEYEYVSGRWDVDSGRLQMPEATLLEGNNVYADQTWYAIAYYRDQSALSYDRIVGVGVDVSGGR